MLQLRPNCELCDKDLPADSQDARICSYECTFCSDCVDHVLQNVCPNCGGGFVPRPLRPKQQHRPGVCLELQPGSLERKHSPYDASSLKDFVDSLKAVPPEKR